MNRSVRARCPRCGEAGRFEGTHLDLPTSLVGVATEMGPLDAPKFSCANCGNMWTERS